MTRAIASASRQVLAAAATAAQDREPAALALVLGTEGSTYVGRGAMALFGGRAQQVGWLSGGCLESEIAQVAQRAVEHQRIEWMDIDTRDDDSLLSGSATGCRGRLHLALIPLAALAGLSNVIEHWQRKVAALSISLSADGGLQAVSGDQHGDWQLTVANGSTLSASHWRLDFDALPRVCLFGGGPESAPLLPLLRQGGWRTLLVERRERWRYAGEAADRLIERSPQDALRDGEVSSASAALVMHHNFERDRDTLETLAATNIPFIGLLGPRRRRDDLFRLLTSEQVESLQPRLHSPVGLDLGGQGAEAIALSIAAQLQMHRHGR
ncbi:MAG: XdhC family protein [Lysobacteraceae bacterium]